MKRPVFGGLRTIKAQTSPHMRVVCAAPLLLIYWTLSYLTCHEGNFNFLASLCSWAGWFVSHFVENPEDSISHGVAHVVMAITTFSINGKIFVISRQNANLKLILINPIIRVPLLLNLYNLWRKFHKMLSKPCIWSHFTPTCLINQARSSF